MPNVPAADPKALPPDLLELDPWYAVLAHRPDIVRCWSDLDAVFFSPTSTVSNEIKEQVRRTLAQGLGCRFCASLGTPRDEHPDTREALAVAFAELVKQDHRDVDESTFDVMREEFTDEEIVELVSWVCFSYGSNMFGALMNLAPATDSEIKAYAAFVGSGA